MCDIFYNGGVFLYLLVRCFNNFFYLVVRVVYVSVGSFFILVGIVEYIDFWFRMMFIVIISSFLLVVDVS